MSVTTLTKRGVQPHLHEGQISYIIYNQFLPLECWVKFFQKSW